MEHWYQAGFCIFQFQFQIQSKKKNNNIHLRNLQLINLNVNHIVLSKQWEISFISYYLSNGKYLTQSKEQIK